MAKTREEVCIYYMAFGMCKKGREASQKGYCQKCSKYLPRCRKRRLNRKKSAIEKLKLRETD